MMRPRRGRGSPARTSAGRASVAWCARAKHTAMSRRHDERPDRRPGADRLCRREADLAGGRRHDHGVSARGSVTHDTAALPPGVASLELVTDLREFGKGLHLALGLAAIQIAELPFLKGMPPGRAALRNRKDHPSTHEGPVDQPVQDGDRESTQTDTRSP